MGKRKSDQFDHSSYFTHPISRKKVALSQVDAYKGARGFLEENVMRQYKEHQRENYGRVLLSPNLTSQSDALMTYKGMEAARNSSCSLMGQLCSNIFIYGYRLLFDQYIYSEASELTLQEGSKRRHIDFKLELPEKVFYFSVKSTTRERAPNAWKAELAHLQEKAATPKPWALVGVFYEAGLDWPAKTIPKEIGKIIADVDSLNSGNFLAVGICDAEAHIRFLSELSFYL